MDGKILVVIVFNELSVLSNIVKLVVSVWKCNKYGIYYMEESVRFINGN